MRSAILSERRTGNLAYAFIAPPQYKGLWRCALLSLDENPEWLTKDAWVITQIHRSNTKP